MEKKTILLITTPAMGKTREVKRLKGLGYKVMDFDIKGTKPQNFTDSEEFTRDMQQANLAYLEAIGGYYDFIAIHSGALNMREIYQFNSYKFLNQFQVVYLLPRRDLLYALNQRIELRQPGTPFVQEAANNYDQWLTNLEGEVRFVCEEAHRTRTNYPMVFEMYDDLCYVKDVTSFLLTAEEEFMPHSIRDITLDILTDIQDEWWKEYFQQSDAGSAYAKEVFK